MSRWKSAQGITLVELLIVLGMMSILAAMAIPGMARMGVFSRNEMQRSARELYAFMRAARIYAATYNVNTAVAYSLDNYTSPSRDANNDGIDDITGESLIEPVVDTVTGNTIRIIRSAAMLYELPISSGEFAGKYVPVAGEQGNFRPLLGQTCVLLNNPEPLRDVRGNIIAASLERPLIMDDANSLALRPRLTGDFPTSGDFGLSAMGMTKVEVYLEDSGPLTDPEDPAFLQPVTAFFPAHVFQNSGRVKTNGEKERYAIFVSASPEEDQAERLVDATNPRDEVIHIPIQIFKSTGRVKIAS